MSQNNQQTEDHEQNSAKTPLELVKEQQEKEHQENEDHEQNPAKTPLELVKEQQRMQQQNHEVLDQRVESGAEVPGGSVPSDRRKHPQRQLG